jgi:alpha-1,2-mannosyltransferase
MRLAVRFAPVVLLLALTAHLVAVAIWTRGLTALYDLGVYRAGGRALLDGRSLYDGDVFWVLKFTYPPFAAAVFTPLALLSPDAAKLAFTGVNIAALGAAVWLSLRSLGHRPDRRLAMVTIGLTGLLFWLEPVRSTIDIGQVNLLLMVLLLWDLTRPAGSRLQGIGVGIAAGMKLIPIIFVAYLLLTGRRAAAGRAVGVLACTVGFGFLVAPTDSWHYWGGTFLTTNRIGEFAERGNQSLSGLLARLAEPAPHSVALWLLLAGLAGVGGLTIAVRAHRRGHELLAVTVCGLTSCAVAPFAWNHHWVWFVPLLVLLGHAARTGKVPVAAPVGLFLLLVDWPVVLAPRDGIFPPPTGLIATPVGGVAGFLARNLYVLVAVVVVVLATARLRAGSDPAGDPAPAGDLGEHDAGGHRGVE